MDPHANQTALESIYFLFPMMNQTQVRFSHFLFTLDLRFVLHYLALQALYSFFERFIAHILDYTSQPTKLSI